MSTLRTETLQTTDSAHSVTVVQLAGLYEAGGAVERISDSTYTVANIAALKTVSKLLYKYVYVNDYYGVGSGGGGQFRYDAADTTSADNGGTIIVAVDGARWKRVSTSVITTKQFGCRADGATDDYAAIQKWFAFGIANKVEMVISGGVHKINSPLQWDFTPVATIGINIRGEGPLVNCRLDLSSVTGTQPVMFYGTGTTALFYIRLSGFSITTDYNGWGVMFGKADYTDAWNECTIDLWINNQSTGANAASCVLNLVLHSDIRLVCNGSGSGRPDAPTYPGTGTALILRQAIMNNLMLALGNANKGLYITGGYSYRNVFSAMDIEEINYGVIIDVATATQNNFLGGTYLSYNVLNCTAGAQNNFSNCGIQAYAGGTVKVATVGCTLTNSQTYDVGTPSMPASGAIVANNTGRAVMVHLGSGTVSAINITQFGGLGTVGIPIGAWSRADFMLQPGESVTLTYSVTPAWLWRFVA